MFNARSFVWKYDAKKKLVITNIRANCNDDKADIFATVENEVGYIPYQYVEYVVPFSEDILFKYEWIKDDWS